jgi:ATP adenylyltransferase
MSICSLCRNSISRHASAAWNRPVFESENFVALASLGSLVEGWLLLLPKVHYISVGALPRGLIAEFEQVKQLLVERLQNEYGSVCAFEHGPSTPSRKIGCSVDHAHLHLVPLSFDLANAASPFLPLGTEWKEATWENCHSACAGNQDYLYLEQPLGKGRISTHGHFDSQIFREGIASYLRKLSEYSWREYPQLDLLNPAEYSGISQIKKPASRRR